MTRGVWGALVSRSCRACWDNAGCSLQPGVRQVAEETVLNTARREKGKKARAKTKRKVRATTNQKATQSRSLMKARREEIEEEKGAG